MDLNQTPKTAPPLPTDGGLMTVPTTDQGTPNVQEMHNRSASDGDDQARAMTNPATRTFLGKPLRPFSWRRQEAADKLGLLFFKLHDDVADEFAETGTYDGIAGDAAIVVYLCTLSDNEVYKAIRLAEKYTKKRLEWCDSIGLGIGNAVHRELLEVFAEIVNDFMASIASPKEKGPGKPDLEQPEEQPAPPASPPPPLPGSLGSSTPSPGSAPPPSSTR